MPETFTKSIDEEIITGNGKWLGNTNFPTLKGMSQSELSRLKIKLQDQIPHGLRL